MHTHAHAQKPALTSAAGTPVADLHVRAGLIGRNVAASDALQARQITHHTWGDRTQCGSQATLHTHWLGVLADRHSVLWCMGKDEKHQNDSAVKPT